MNILANLKTYILVVAALAAVGFGYLSYSLTERNARLEADILTLQATSQANEKALENARAECERTAKSVQEFYENKLSRQQAADRLLCALDSLPSASSPAPDTKPRGNPENAPETKSGPVAGNDDRISDDLDRLLHETYCRAVQDDPSCSAFRDDGGV